jgi:plastocyanin
VTAPYRRPSAAIASVLAASALLFAGCGGGGGGGGQGYQPPKGPSTETVSVEAGSYYFKPDALTANAGIATIKLDGAGGEHTFVFDGAYSGFQLEVSGSGDSQSQKIDLKPGKYTFYCNIVGHRAQGMHGTLTVK